MYKNSVRRCVSRYTPSFCPTTTMKFIVSAFQVIFLNMSNICSGLTLTIWFSRAFFTIFQMSHFPYIAPSQMQQGSVLLDLDIQ